MTTCRGSACKTASELHAKVRLGHDPAAEKAEGRARVVETFGAVLVAYLAYQKDRLKPRSYIEVVRHLTKYAKLLHCEPLAKISRRTIAARLKFITIDNGKSTANRVRTSLSAFFTWSMRILSDFYAQIDVKGVEALPADQAAPLWQMAQVRVETFMRFHRAVSYPSSALAG